MVKKNRKGMLRKWANYFSGSKKISWRLAGKKFRDWACAWIPAREAKNVKADTLAINTNGKNCSTWNIKARERNFHWQAVKLDNGKQCGASEDIWLV